MHLEIERKFLVKDDSWKKTITDHYNIMQAYIDANTRIRISNKTKTDQAFITIKSGINLFNRNEYSYEIPVEQARRIIISLYENNCVEKSRYIIFGPDSHTWEVDEFHGKNKGLVIAEVELTNKMEEITAYPSWVGAEVTENARYYNHNLAKHPYSEWGSDRG
jgi:adenylate cyclase